MMEEETVRFHLDERLAACAEMLSGRPLADIGTDHAYLPLFAVLSGIAERAVAADIREGPLERARLHVEKYGAEGKIALRLSDGLHNIGPAEADDIVIAGMGGETILQILSETDWVRDPAKRLILQPMSKEETLRCWLREQGFTAEREKAVLSSGKVYAVMQVSYTGISRNEGELFPLIGLLEGKTEAEEVYIKKKIQSLEKQRLGLSDTAETDRLIGLLREKIGGKE